MPRTLRAGTAALLAATPMSMRKDAGMAALMLGAKVNTAFTKIAGPRSVWTFGEVRFFPSTGSIIAGRAELRLQWRDSSEAQLEKFMDELQSIVRRALTAGLRSAEDFLKVSE